MYLESLKHKESSFVTLTYAPENLPQGATLVPRDAQLWLKRLREECEPQRIRYYLVGEYGDESARPHYHVAIFGMGMASVLRSGPFPEVVNRTWAKGHTYVGDLTMESAQYVAGYVTKKMTQKDDVRLNGRHPEFSRMSLRPGIGALTMDDLAEVVGSKYGLDDVLERGDVPHVLRHGARLLPLGRYLRRKLREKIGFASGDAPESAVRRFSTEMRLLLEDALKVPENTSKSIGKILVDMNAQKVLNLEARNKIFTRKGEI